MRAIFCAGDNRNRTGKSILIEETNKCGRAKTSLSWEYGWAAVQDMRRSSLLRPLFSLCQECACLQFSTSLLADQALKACYGCIALTTISSVITQKVINIRLFLSNGSRSLVRNPNKVWASQFLGLALLSWLPSAFWKEEETNSMGFATAKWKRVSFLHFVPVAWSPICGTEAICQDGCSWHCCTYPRAWQSSILRKEKGPLRVVGEWNRLSAGLKLALGPWYCSLLRSQVVWQISPCVQQQSGSVGGSTGALVCPHWPCSMEHLPQSLLFGQQLVL